MALSFRLLIAVLVHRPELVLGLLHVALEDLTIQRTAHSLRLSNRLQLTLLRLVLVGLVILVCLWLQRHVDGIVEPLAIWNRLEQRVVDRLLVFEAHHVLLAGLHSVELMHVFKVLRFVDEASSWTSTMRSQGLLRF